MGLLVYPLIQGRESGWPAWTFVLLGAGIALLAGFTWWERHRRSAPLIDPRARLRQGGDIENETAW